MKHPEHTQANVTQHESFDHESFASAFNFLIGVKWFIAINHFTTKRKLNFKNLMWFKKLLSV